MRRKIFFALMTALLLLTLSACGGSVDAERFQELRERLSDASGDVTALVCVEHGETRREYKLAFSGDETNCTVEVLEPAGIAGVRVMISEEGKKVAYEDIVLSMGDTGCAVTPATALPVIFGALKDGWTEQVWREELEEIPCMAVRLVYDGSTSMTVWLRYRELIPVYAEIISGGEVCLSCRILGWNVG